MSRGAAWMLGMLAVATVGCGGRSAATGDAAAEGDGGPSGSVDGETKPIDGARPGRDAASDASRGRDSGGDGRGSDASFESGQRVQDSGLDVAREGVAPDSGACVPPSTVTADVFVSPEGNDGWSGTKATSDGQGNGPFLTLTRAQTAVRAARVAKPSSPVTVDLRGGTYELASTLSLTSADSGASSALVTYQAYPCETPVLSGGRQIAPSAWHLVAGSSPPTYTTTIPPSAAFSSQFTPFEQLWVDGSRVFRPRAGGWSYLTIKQTPAPGQTAQDSTFLPSDTTLLPAGLSDPDVEVVVFEQWTVSRQRLASVLANGGITTTAFGDQSSYHGYLRGHRIYIDNVQAAFSAAGQWYLDKSTMALSYIARAGEDLTASTPVVYPVLSTLVSADKVSYLTFSGITFAYSNWTVPSGGYSAGQGLWGLPAAVALKDTASVTFTSCSFTHTGATGVTIDGTGASGWTSSASSPFSNELTGNTFSDLGANALRIGATPSGSATTLSSVAGYVHVANNLFTGGSRFSHSGMGILVGDSPWNTIEHNEIADFYQTGIAVGFTFAQIDQTTGVATYPSALTVHETIEDNLIHDIGEGVTNDMGGVYLLTSDEGAGTGPLVQGNVIHDVVNDPSSSYQGANGIYFDQGTSNATAENNLVYRVSGAGFDENYGRNNVIHNNLFAYPRDGMFNHVLHESSGLWATFSNNLFVYDENNASFSLFAAGAGFSCPAAGCVGWMDFTDNLYWDTSHPTASGVVFKLTSPSGADTFAWWQTTEHEDSGGMVADPQLTSLSGTGFTLAATSPALTSAIFTPFDTSSAGPTSPPPAASPAPQAVPLQVPATPASFF